MYKIHTPSHRFDTQNLQIFAIFGKIRLIFQIFANVAEIAAKNVIFRWNFRRILPEFHRISAILIKQTILFSFQMNFEKNAATFAENLLFLAGRQSAKVPPSPWSRWPKFKQPSKSRYFDSRMEKRKAEMNGLQEAKAVLAGAESEGPALVRHWKNFCQIFVKFL